MTIHILACGSSAKNYKGQLPCIGVNDAGKWGYTIDHLLVLNEPNKFTAERLEVIKNTRAIFITNTPNQWVRVLGHNVDEFNSRKWSASNRIQKISKNYLYHSKTSPFAAISLAYSWECDEIVLWGVDMVDHRTYSPKGSIGEFTNEYNAFKTFSMALNDVGVKVYLGNEGSNLKFLPIWS